MHRKAHGLVADKLIEVQPDLVEGFFGTSEVNSAGAVLLPGGWHHGPDWFALVLTAAAFAALQLLELDAIWVVLAGGAAGLAWTLLK